MSQLLDKQNETHNVLGPPLHVAPKEYILAKHTQKKGQWRKQWKLTKLLNKYVVIV